MQYSKNLQEKSQRDLMEKVELLSAIAFIEETMKTLATY